MLKTCIHKKIHKIFINSLFERVLLPLLCFADDLIFIIDVTEHDRNFIQSQVHIIVSRSDEHLAPPSLEKSSVLHCDRCSIVIKSVDTFADLGIIHSFNGICAAYINGLVYRSFCSRKKQLIWFAF